VIQTILERCTPIWSRQIFPHISLDICHVKNFKIELVCLNKIYILCSNFLYNELFLRNIVSLIWASCEGGVNIRLIKVKGNDVPVLFSEHHIMKVYWGSGSITPLIRWPQHYMEVSGQLHTAATLPPGKEPPVPIGYEAGWAPELIWTRWRRERCWAKPRKLDNTV